jgi:hypothetical protein|eukprot:4977537-Prymnesium_polylepis.1
MPLQPLLGTVAAVLVAIFGYVSPVPDSYSYSNEKERIVFEGGHSLPETPIFPWKYAALGVLFGENR